MMQVVVNVLEDGKPMMQGKTIVTVDNCWFLHRANSNQWHYETNSPCGIDVTVLRWLRDQDIEEIHFHDVTRRMLYCTNLDTMREHGVIQTSRGTTRCFLPDRYWDAYPLIGNELPYKEPHLREEVNLDPYRKGAGKTPQPTTNKKSVLPDPQLQPKLL